MAGIGDMKPKIINTLLFISNIIYIALRWDIPGTLNGTKGTWELVIDVDTETVLHFLFNSK